MPVPKWHIVAAILVLSTGQSLQAGVRQSQSSDAGQPAVGGAYVESPDELKRLVQGLVDALASDDSDRWSSLIAGLTIPDHGAWFAKAFGPDEGARLESKYVETLPRLSTKLRQRINHALDGQLDEVKVEVLQKPNPNTGEMLDRALFRAMASPVTIYRAKGLGLVNGGGGPGPMDRFATYFGDFVFVDGAFRDIDSEVFEALSTVPQPRIRQAEKVTTGSILYQPSPEYPREARAKHIEGDVVFHVIINKDGTIRNMEVVSGAPELIPAAMDAVKKWRYKPTLLSGQPVEVETAITVTFRFNR